LAVPAKNLFISMNKKIASKGKKTHKIGGVGWKLKRYWIHMKNKNKPKPDWVPKPLKKKCFQCKSNILISFVIPKKDYSWKNSLEYWTENEDNKDKYLCNKCLIELYNDKLRYWSMVTNPKKKQRMKTYIYTGAIFLE